ncbi:MAG: PAS domain S-box protein [Candidatus Thorarchaeota archaeon]
MKARVLIVDDDEDLLLLAKRFLAGYSTEFELVPVTTAQDAIQELDEGEIDAVVCDFFLGPEQMNGVEILEWLRDEGHDTPFIIFTGRSREEVAIQALNLGADYYLEKGNDLEGLFKEIGHHIKSVLRSRRMEEALRESEVRFRNVFDSIPIGIHMYELNDDQLIFIDANDAASRILGVDCQRFIGMTLEDAFPPLAESEVPHRYREAAKRGIPWETEETTYSHGEISGAYEVYAFQTSPGRMVAAFSDITHEKRISIELSDERNRAQSYLDLAGTLILATDTELNITLVNREGCRILGLPEEDILGKNWIDSFIPEWRRDVIRGYMRGIIAGITEPTKSDEGPVISQSGDIKWIQWSDVVLRDEEGDAIGVLSAGPDVTKRLESEQQYGRILDSLGDSVHVVDGDFRITLTNPALIQWLVELGLNTEIVGKGLWEAFPFLDDSVREEYQRVFETGDPITTIDRSQISGTEFIAETLKIPVIAEGEVTEVVTIVRDITSRVQAEEALKLTQFTVDSSSDPAFWMGPDAKFVYVNDAACKSLDYSREELLTMTVHDIDPFFPEEVWASHWEEIKEKKSFTIESQHRTKDGQTFPVEISINYMEFEGKEFNCAFARNIEERVQRIGEIRESERRHRTVVESMQDLIFVFDENDSPTEYYAPSEHLLYARAEHFRGKHVSDVLPPEVANQYARQSHELRVTRVPKRFDYSLDLNGGKRWFEASLTLHEDGVSIVAVVHDITERKRTEEWADEQRSFLEKVIDSLTLPFYVVDPKDHTIKLANRTTCLGPLTGSETCHSHSHHRDSPCDAAEFGCPLSQVVATGKPAVVEHQHYDFAGRLRDLEVHGCPIFDSEGAVAQVIKYDVDITEQKNVRMLLEKQKEELSELAHVMSHDLGNKMQNIRAMIGLLKHEYNEDLLGRIDKLASQTAQLLKSSAELADAGGAVDMTKEVDLDVLVREIANTTIPDHIALSHDMLPVVSGSIERLGQVFHNLFENAVEHADPSRIEVRLMEENGSLSLLVYNDGALIPETDAAKVFERGFTTKTEGRGLGMTIVKRIVQAHGWEVSLITTPRTCFRIHIGFKGQARGHEDSSKRGRL